MMEIVTQKKSFVHIILFSILSFLLFVFAYRNFLSKGMIYFGDVIPFPLTANEAFDAFLNSWSSSYLGIEMNAPPLYYIIIGFFLSIFRDPEIAQKLYYFSPLFIASIGMYLFLGQFIKSAPARYVGAFTYAINPIASYGGPPGPMTFVYSLFPFMFLYLIHFLENRHRVLDLLFFILFAAFSMFFSFYSVFLFLPVIIISLFIYFLYTKKLRYILFSLLLFVLAGLFIILLVLPTFLPTISGTSYVMSGESIEDHIATINITYSDASIFRLLRLTGHTGASDSYFGYKSIEIWTLFGYLIPFLALLPLFLTDQKKRRYIYLLILLSIVIILQLWLTYKGLTIDLFLRFPLLLILRNPKLLGIFLLAFIPLFAIGIEIIIQKINRSAFKFIFCAILILMLSIYNWPFFTGDMGTGHVAKQFKMNPEISPEIYKIGRWINDQRKKEGFFRTLWVPFDANTQLSLQWIDPYIFNTVIGAERNLHIPNIAYIKSALNSICNRYTNNVSLGLGIANVKYIIINLNNTSGLTDCYLDGFYLKGNPSEFIKIFKNNDRFELAVKEDIFLIYKNKDFIPHLTLYNDEINSGNNQPSFSEFDQSKIKNNPVISAAKYQIDLSLDKPTNIILGETYHPDWNAYYSDGTPLNHVQAFSWSNNFYVDRIGENKITIKFLKQDKRDLIVKIWGIAWIFVITAIVINYIIDFRKKNDQY